MSTVPNQSRVQAVRQFKSWLVWAFDNRSPMRVADTEGDIRYAIERGRELMLTEEEMAPLHQFIARRSL